MFALPNNDQTSSTFYWYYIVFIQGLRHLFVRIYSNFGLMERLFPTLTTTMAIEIM